MKLSLITINRNNRSGLKRTLDSIASQLPRIKDKCEFEHIVVDGESTDGSLSELLPELNSVVVVSPPKGVYNAINEGLRHVTGDVVGLLHSGDVFHADNVLPLVLDVFKKEPETDYVFGNVILGHRNYVGDKFDENTLAEGYAPPHPSLYVRRKVVDTIGFYDDTFRVAADFDYFVRIARDKSLHGRYLPVPMVRMETGGLSTKLYNRIFINNKEKIRSLRKNGLRSGYFRILKHYLKIVKSYI